jgi:hypothetical protein
MTDPNTQNADDQIPNLDEDLDPERPPRSAEQTDVQQPAIIAGVGSSALGSVDIEPQPDYPPDNDGETVEQ